MKKEKEVKMTQIQVPLGEKRFWRFWTFWPCLDNFEDFITGFVLQIM